MNKIDIAFGDHGRHLRSGQWVGGRVSWNFSAPPKSLEIRLIWFTRGKGTTDTNTVETREMADPTSTGDVYFRFDLPEAPHSFSGHLISLVWAIEVVAFPAKISERAEFFLSPTGQEILLPRADKPMTPLERKRKERQDELLNRINQ